MPLYPDIARGHQETGHVAVTTHLEHAWHFAVRHAVQIGLGLLILLAVSGMLLAAVSYKNRGAAKVRERLWSGWAETDAAKKKEIFEGLVAAETTGTVPFFARMELGKATFGQGDFEAALGHFIAARQLAQPGSIHESLSLYAVVAAQESLGRHAEALALLDGPATSENPKLADRAMFQKGMILELTGDRDQAKEIYRKLATGGEFLDSPFREEAVERLLWLASSPTTSAK